MINSTPTYLASVWGSSPQKGGWRAIQNSEEPCLLPLYSTGSITDWQVNLFVTNGAANEREALGGGGPPLVCFCHRLEDQQSSRSLICVFSPSGSLSRPDRSALIKSGFSISITACSMGSRAPGWQSPLLSATLPPTNTHTHAGRQNLFSILVNGVTKSSVTRPYIRNYCLNWLPVVSWSQRLQNTRRHPIHPERHPYPLTLCLHRKKPFSTLSSFFCQRKLHISALI